MCYMSLLRTAGSNAQVAYVSVCVATLRIDQDNAQLWMCVCLPSRDSRRYKRSRVICI